jgi:hypothetical protein
MDIPGPLRLIHGRNASAFDVTVVYGAGVVAAVLVLVFASSRVPGLTWWKAVLLFLVAFDVAAGAVAIFTPGTGRFYAARPALRWAVIVLHVIQPGILFLLFDGRLAYWCFLCGFTIAAASLVNIMKDRQRQQAAAAALVAIGIVVLLPIGLSTPFLAWFGPVYMVKLILGFAVRRTEEE